MLMRRRGLVREEGGEERTEDAVKRMDIRRNGTVEDDEENRRMRYVMGGHTPRE